MSVKICVSYSDEKEFSEIISRLNLNGIKVSKPYSSGRFSRRYITFHPVKKTLDKTEQKRYNNIEQTFCVKDVEKEYPIF